MTRLLEGRRWRGSRILLVLVLGFVLGGLMTRLAQFMPESATREFLTAAVTASLGPVSIGLVSFSITLGPLGFHLNVLTLAAIGIVTPIVRSWM